MFHDDDDAGRNILPRIHFEILMSRPFFLTENTQNSRRTSCDGTATSVMSTISISPIITPVAAAAMEVICCC